MTHDMTPGDTAPLQNHGERILKIGPHLPKFLSKSKWLTFWDTVYIRIFFNMKNGGPPPNNFHLEPPLGIVSSFLDNSTRKIQLQHIHDKECKTRPQIRTAYKRDSSLFGKRWIIKKWESRDAAGGPGISQKNFKL